MEEKTFWDIFKSRKFWVLVLALLAATAAFATQRIDGWQFVQALVVALAAYSTGVAIEDAGAKAGAGMAAGRSPASIASLQDASQSHLTPLPPAEWEKDQISNRLQGSRGRRYKL
jgi:hypothetical protein